METQRMNEKESLAIISEMIEATRNKMQTGSGNLFLIYGYSLAIVSLLVFVIQYFLHNHMGSWLWMSMFGVMFFIKSRRIGETDPVVTYTDQAIAGVWQIIALLFMLTFLVVLLCGYFLSFNLFNLMLPLSLIYISIGTSVTGLLLKEPLIKYIPALSFVCGLYMLVTYMTNGYSDSVWNLYFCISSVVTMIIPGYILNRKSKR
ncbi:MAG: hypothetical protein ACRCX4_04135 [Bacteroidales bacterium]